MKNASTLSVVVVLKSVILLAIELIYTSWDIKPFADDVWREAGEALRDRIRQQLQENKESTSGHEWADIAEDGTSRYGRDGIPLPPFKWDEDRRAILRAELDVYYAHLYGLTRDEMRYILDPQEVYGPDFPGETFRVLKEKEIKKYSEYRTRRLVLEAWDRLFEKETYVPKEVLQPQVTQEIEPEPTPEDIQATREYATLLIAANVESALRVYAAKILYFCALRGSSLRDKLNFNWMLEKHGPYDHAIGQLRDRMLQAGYLERVPTQDYGSPRGIVNIKQGNPHGKASIPRGKPFKITSAGENKLQEFEQLEVIRQSKPIIESVLREFAGKTSREMELRATLVFLHKQHPDWGYEQLVAALQAEKAERRFGENEIDEAVRELEGVGYISAQAAITNS